MMLPQHLVERRKVFETSLYAVEILVNPMRLFISKFRCFVFVCFLVFAPTLFAQSPEQVSNEQILRAIHLTTDLLDSTRKVWISSTPYCYTCHHEGLQFRVDRVAAEHGLPVDRNAENEHFRMIVGQVHYKNESLFGVDAGLRGIQIINPAEVSAVALTSFHDLGVPPSLPLEVKAQRLAKLQRPDGYWVTMDERPPQDASRFTTTAYAIEAIKDYLPEQLGSEKREVISRARGWLLTSLPRDSEDEAMQLFGLKSAGVSGKEIDPIAKRLIAEQRRDGRMGSIEKP